MNVSIIIPNHNDLRISKLIKSIDYYSDSDKNVEILIILNNPTPELEKQCKEISEKYKKKFSFKLLYTSHQNLGYLYNFGLKESSHEHIMFLDSDITCAEGAIQKVVDAMNEEIQLVKANLLYKDMNGLVERARFCNTTKDVPPYIPVILIKKEIFKHFKDDFIFAVDVVWCSDAEFAYRVIYEKINFSYVDANFYHDSISIKKDIKDAALYGFGKGIRIKRTREEWKPLNEIMNMSKKARQNNLTFLEKSYCVFWITLQQISCGIQVLSPNLFKNSMNFEESMKRSELYN